VFLILEMYCQSSWEKKKEFHNSALTLYRHLKQIYFHDSRKMDEKIGQIFKKEFVMNWTPRVVNWQAETWRVWAYPDMLTISLPLDEWSQNLETPEWIKEIFRRFLRSICFILYFTLSHIVIELSLLTPITAPERVSIGPCQVAANASDGRYLWRK
jgi:hypothetical protein